MKKILLLAGFLLTGLTQAQTITVNNAAGGTIENNQVFTYTTLDSSAKLTFSVTNNTNEDIYLRTRVDAMSGTDGSDVQLCFEVCLYNLSVGLTVPSYLPSIPANSTTPSPDDHMYNFNPGNGIDPVVYTISFVQYDANGTELGNLITFTYQYVPTAGTEDFTKLENAGINLSNTLLKDALSFSSQNNGTVEMYAVNGHLVKSASYNAGSSNAMDVSSLAAGMYIARFTAEGTKPVQIRVAKQ